MRRPIFIVAAPRSGSTLLFETLAKGRHFSTLGGEAHWLVEGHPELRPGAPGVGSNRLVAHQATDIIADHMMDQILSRLLDRTGAPVQDGANSVFLEKTPKNALRIPFFDRIFPDARFVLLWRDPRENVSSIIEAWRSGRFITYKHVEGFHGPWSLMLPPGYRELCGKPLEEIAAHQWNSANILMLDDLARLDPARWMSVEYARLIDRPGPTIQRICDFAEVDFDPDWSRRLSKGLPYSRSTNTAPAPDKWRANAVAVNKVLPALEPTWGRLKGLA